jgi:hypothetical protein
MLSIDRNLRKLLQVLQFSLNLLNKKILIFFFAYRQVAIIPHTMTDGFTTHLQLEVKLLLQYFDLIDYILAY